MTRFVFWLGLGLFFFGCRNHEKLNENKAGFSGEERIEYASGLSIRNYKDFTIVTVINPWPTEQASYRYLLYKKEQNIPDTLKTVPAIKVPVETLVVTSTTHLPALELLDRVHSLKGFPNTNYVSSAVIRDRIEEGHIREVGSNQQLNTEVLLDMNPDVIMGFGVDGQKKTYDHLQQNGLKVIYNGDWTEQDPLGRAEWIKLFGALFDLQDKADEVFNSIVDEYMKARELAAEIKEKPTVMSGSVYQDQWYLPQGKSWAARFLAEANAQYLWSHTEGTGSLSFSFEAVFDQAQDADFWIGPGQFTSYDQLMAANPNYRFFKAVAQRKVYSFSSKKGPTGGIIYYEEASARPDRVLKDLIAILHPELLPGYELYFFEPLK